MTHEDALNKILEIEPIFNIDDEEDSKSFNRLIGLTDSRETFESIDKIKVYRTKIIFDTFCMGFRENEWRKNDPNSYQIGSCWYSKGEETENYWIPIIKDNVFRLVHINNLGYGHQQCKKLIYSRMNYQIADKILNDDRKENFNFSIGIDLEKTEELKTIWKNKVQEKIDSRLARKKQRVKNIEKGLKSEKVFQFFCPEHFGDYILAEDYKEFKKGDIITIHWIDNLSIKVHLKSKNRLVKNRFDYLTSSEFNKIKVTLKDLCL